MNAILKKSLTILIDTNILFCGCYELSDYHYLADGQIKMGKSEDYTRPIPSNNHSLD